MWGFFDKIYCINLATRDDRHVRAQALFEVLGIPVEFYRPTKHPDGGLRGCFESHMHLIHTAYDMGYKNILVFEDDIIAKMDKKSVEENVCRAKSFMERNFTWDLFYLGVVPDVRSRGCSRVGRRVYKLTGLCTHAVVYSRRFMHKMRNIAWNGVPLDYYYREFPEQYALYPSIFYQAPGDPSDIANVNSLASKMCETTKRFVPMLEAYAYYIGVHIPIVALAIVVALVLVYMRRRKIL